MSPHAGRPAHRFHRHGLPVCRELSTLPPSPGQDALWRSAHTACWLRPSNLQGYPRQCFTRFEKGIIIEISTQMMEEGDRCQRKITPAPATSDTTRPWTRALNVHNGPCALRQHAGEDNLPLKGTTNLQPEGFTVSKDRKPSHYSV